MPPRQSTSQAPAQPQAAPAPAQHVAGTPLSIDDLFGSAKTNGAVSHSSAPPAPANDLLAMLKNASIAQNGILKTMDRPGHQRQSSAQIMAEIEAAQANGRAVLQHLASVSPVPAPQPQPQLAQHRSPPAVGLVPRRVSDRHKKSPPTAQPQYLPPAVSSAQVQQALAYPASSSQLPPVVPEAARPPVKTEVDDVAEVSASWAVARNDDGSPLSKREYVQHLLTLVHVSDRAPRALTRADRAYVCCRDL